MPDAFQQSVATAFAVTIFAVAVSVETRLVRRVTREGGQVRTADWQMPDALVALVLASFFAVLGVVPIFLHPQKSSVITIDKVVVGSAFPVVLLIGVAGFLTFRGAKVSALLGLKRLGMLRAFAWALGLVLAAFPLAGAANLLTAALLHGRVEPQELVQLFHTVAERGDLGAMLKIFLAGAVLAPVCEEFLFRGFFYAVGKRYLGPLASGLLTALLFAAIHQSLTAFAGLFVLAVCFTLAYERTGSLLVPIGMHALYNFTSLFFIWLQARGALPTS